MHGLTYTDLKKAFSYIYSQQNKVFPYKNGLEFNKALKSYTPWKCYRYDIGTSKEKFGISFPKDFMTKVKEWKSNIITTKVIEEITQDIYNKIPYGSNVTDEMITYNTDETQIRSLNTMIDICKNIKTTLALIAVPGVGKTVATNSFISSLPPDIKDLVISFRIALARKQQTDLNGLEFKHYQDKEFAEKPIIKLTEVI